MASEESQQIFCWGEIVREVYVSRAGDKALTRETPVQKGRVNRYGYELWCSARLSGSCYTTGTCCFPFVGNLVISHYRGKEVVNTSNGAKSNGIHKC